LGELDEIVIQLFDDLDGKSLATQTPRPATELRAAEPHSPPRTAERRSAEPSGAEIDEAEAQESAAEDAPPQQFLESGEASGAVRRESLPPLSGIEAEAELSVPSDDKGFIDLAVTWLASRPNAEHLLERIWLSLIEREAAERAGECTPIDESEDGPPRPIPHGTDRRYGAGDDEMATSSLYQADGGAAMPQPKDLSRSLVALDRIPARKPHFSPQDRRNPARHGLSAGGSRIRTAGPSRGRGCWSPRGSFAAP
jgi:hypothetical protein